MYGIEKSGWGGWPSCTRGRAGRRTSPPPGRAQSLLKPYRKSDGGEAQTSPTSTATMTPSTRTPRKAGLRGPARRRGQAHGIAPRRQHPNRAVEVPAGVLALEERRGAEGLQHRSGPERVAVGGDVAVKGAVEHHQTDAPPSQMRWTRGRDPTGPGYSGC